MVGDLFEMLSKADDLERRPRMRKTLTNTKAVLGCIAAVLAFMGALSLMFKDMQLVWAAALTPTVILAITVAVYFLTGREPEVLEDAANAPAGAAPGNAAAQP